ncbi:delta-aminolevulinic acid dehydratase [Kitasatospora sp. NPDC056446]|uniref:delta-aminolevulinic acid dehydratase n=1 Tax=Kitasatospora sp. NPDC056446 TaxID=3345819 RepID=UPI0036BDE2C9
MDTGLAFLAEGADMLLLEPGMLSVDTLAALKRRTSAPLMPFSVSGEYTRLAPRDPATGKRDFRPLAELFTMLKRTGAERVITYAALDLARLRA